ncbi:helix-hairpin-helix domain-containing protein [Microscilla marina]|uniref:DUF4332 domain-containing protein n=1 Tax=Microscilla marina ATCC 23134 TaxID=313606 RepID=A1ZRE5_MICM2|nr:helix-hairpin-helix domain-containing protein [Microscilla marina]EAY27035.1 hypothetical protein M23134_04723 [Microscilla marina ATCC 23134]
MLKQITPLFEALSTDDKQLVRAKKFEAVATPIDLYEQLAGVHQYAKKIDKFRPSKKELKKRAIREFIPFMLLTPFLIFTLVPSLMLVFTYKKPYPMWMLLVSLGLFSLFGVLWLILTFIPNKRRRKVRIELDAFEFLMPLLLLIQEELKPGEKLHLKLNLHKSSERRFRYTTRKNYLIMPHRLMLRWIPLALLVYGLARVLGIIPALFHDGILVGVVLMVIVLFPLLISLAGTLFGKSPKVKTVLGQAPKIDLKARLADGTLLQVSVAQVTMLTTSVKKKIKLKHFTISKTKKKHKTKTVTTVKMAFPQRQYPLSKEAFMHRFRKKPRISNRTIAKMKRKPGDKRNAVIYTDVIINQGQDHHSLFYTMPDFDWFAKLILKGGYHPLRGITQAKAKTQSVSLDVDRDNLTTIGGIGRATEAKLYDAGVFTFAQLASMSKVEFQALLKKVDISPKQANDWQKQAKELM